MPFELLSNILKDNSTILNIMSFMVRFIILSWKDDIHEWGPGLNGEFLW